LPQKLFIPENRTEVLFKSGRTVDSGSSDGISKS